MSNSFFKKLILLLCFGIFSTTAHAADQLIYLHPTADNVTDGSEFGCLDTEHYNCVNDQTSNAGTGSPTAGTATDYVIISKAGSTNHHELYDLDNSAIPANATISQIRVFVRHIRNGTKNGIVNPCYNDGTTTCDTIDTACSTSSTLTIGTYNFSPAKSLTWLNGLKIGANSASGNACRVTQNYVSVSYNVPPNAPTQNSPANSATGVSLTPTFTMTSTDTNSDKLGYKVTIYSNSGCSAVVSTHEQAVNSTGWSGTNTTCTNAPTSCYTSGTQASFALQSGNALSSGTQYWWKASAKDPDNNGSYTDSSTCNSFTTLAASIVLNTDGTISYGLLGSGASANTTASGLNDTQTVQNDGASAADFNIKTSNATGGTTWTVGSLAGSNVFVHEYSTNAGGAWTKFTTADSYQTLVNNVAASGTQNIDFRLTAPTSSSDSQQKSVTVTIQAVAH